jgi:hypothetical protein
MPKGEAANLAMGGVGPMLTSSGKAAALASGRPASSLTWEGSTNRSWEFSGSGAGNSTRATAVSSSRRRGAIGVPPACGTRRSAWAVARETGAENCSTAGASGMHGAFAFSRSQLKFAAKRSRT